MHIHLLKSGKKSIPNHRSGGDQPDQTINQRTNPTEKLRRLNDKGLDQLLLHKFLNEYGYEKGEITARAIINDILTIIDQYFLVSTLDDEQHHIHYGQLVWMVVPSDEYPQRSKSIAKPDLNPVMLSFFYR